LVARTALEVACEEKLLAALEEDLFSQVTATDDELEAPRVVKDALVALYAALAEPGHNSQKLARACFARIVDVDAVRRCDPLGVLTFVLTQIAESGRVDEVAAERIALLPWAEGEEQVPESVAESMHHVRDRALLYSEDFREGLTSALRDPELAIMVGRLSTELRAALREPSASATRSAG
jgi:hypothetical protein